MADKVILNENPKWLDDSIQFPRLLAEICATQPSLDLQRLADEMDLTVEDVNELFDRAQEKWEQIKQANWEEQQAAKRGP